jgi:ribose transport system substrate-binding protein
MTIVGLGPHGERASPPERVTLLPQDIAEARAKKLRVAIVMHTLESDWAKQLVQGMIGTLGECGAVVIDVVDCHFSSEAQIVALNRLREKSPDAIISLPVDNTAVTKAHLAISDAGIPLVLIDNVPTGMLPGKDYVSLVSADNFGLGKISAKLLSDHMPHGATAGILAYEADFFATNEREIAFSRWMEINRPALPMTTVDLGREVTESLAKGGPVIGIAGQRPFQQGEAVARTTITALLDRRCPDWVALPGLKVSRSNVIECYQSIWREQAPRDILIGFDLTQTK